MWTPLAKPADPVVVVPPIHADGKFIGMLGLTYPGAGGYSYSVPQWVPKTEPSGDLFSKLSKPSDDSWTKQTEPSGDSWNKSDKPSSDSWSKTGKPV